MIRTALLTLLLVGCEGNIDAPKKPQPQPELSCEGRHPAVTTLHRLTPVQYQHAVVELFGGAVQPSGNYPPAFGTSVTGYATEEAPNAVGEQAVTQLMRAADEVAISFAAVASDVLPCSAGASPGQACFTAWLDGTARHAFRRPLDADERAALQQTFDAALADGAPFVDAVAVATSQLLQSPQFLYVVEDAAGSGRALTAYEVASRLSFTLWDSIPDPELMTLAEQGTLLDAKVAAAQAQRMLASPKADPALARFFREWTQAKTLISSDKSSTAFPFFTAEYASALGESFDRFTTAQARTGTLESLLTTTDAYVNAALAPSFGVAAPPAGQWAKVSTDGARFAGLITQPLLLATGAHPAEPSFVFRGRLVQKRLACATLGDPPADAQAQFSAIPLPMNPTAREVSDAVIANGACAGCHKLLNPPGLALEHFDAAGRWRDAYASGRGIETAGTMPGLKSGALGFGSHVELAEGLAKRPEISACAAAQLFRFTFSRMETPDDACAVQAISDALEGGHGRLDGALLALVTTDAFTWRVDP